MASYLPEMTDAQRDCKHQFMRSFGDIVSCMECSLSLDGIRRIQFAKKMAEYLASDEGRAAVEHIHSYFANFRRDSDGPIWSSLAPF